MSAKFTHDTGRGPGHGIVTVDGNAPSQNSGQNPEFALYRASDSQCLSQSGWQGTECYLTPDAWDTDTGNLRLAVGPSVVDHMDSLDMYRLLMRGSGGAGSAHAHTLVVENIVYSTQQGGGGMAPAAVSVAPVPIPEPEPVPEPAPEHTPTILSMGEPTKKQNFLPLIVGLIVCFLLVAAGASYWYLRTHTSQPIAPVPDSAPLQEAPPEPKTEQVLPVPPQESPPEQQAELTPAPTQEPAPEQPAEPAPSTPTVPPVSPQETPPVQQAEPTPPVPSRMPMATAREHLRAGGNAQRSLELARELGRDTADPSTADAVFLLVEDAAQKGNAEAMLLLGVYYDPVTTLPKGSITPDIAQAYNWYTKALTAGHAQAKDALHTLKRTAEAAAAKGDRTAADIVRRWNP